MDTTETLETLRNAVPGTGAPGAPTPRRARRGWTLQRVLTWLAPVAAAVLFVIALGTPAYSNDVLSGLVCAALAAIGLAVAPRWPLLALALCLASGLVWLIPGTEPVTNTNVSTSYITTLVAALLVVALLTLQREPERSHRRLVILTGVSVVVLAALQTLTATFGAQARALRLGSGPFWVGGGSVETDAVPEEWVTTPLEAVESFGGPIFAAYLTSFAAAVLGGWVLSLVLASRTGRLQEHPWIGSSRLARGVRRPRVALALLIGTACAVYIGAAVVQNGNSIASVVLTGGLLAFIGVGATLAPLRRVLGASLVAAGCIATSAAGFLRPWIAEWSAGSIVIAAAAAILIVLLALPSGRRWWWTAAMLVVLGAALYTPFLAQQNHLSARSNAYSAAMQNLPKSSDLPGFPGEDEWAAMSDEEATRVEQKYIAIDQESSRQAITVMDEKVPDIPYGGPTTVALAFLQALPLFLLPAVLAWGLKLTTNVAFERRRLAQARAELEASEQDRARQDERRGIAGDVHDVLAHSLTVIVAQGEGALVSQGTEQQDAVRRMVDVARASLRDVRALIERLDGEDTALPAPGLAHLPGLIQNVRDAGLCLKTEEFGERLPLGDSTELALYRILQEALTNVLTHGGRGATARLVLDWRGEDPGLTVTLASTTTPSAEPRPGTGLGLEGMRTRAAVAGGWLTAGADDAAAGPGGTPASATTRDGAADAGSGWLVTAHLPAVAESAVVLR
ncbi:sensor histidine kinase [Galactobacter valiniphilus]|uniref:sensor histidine kinase n=1 Tax=Galactobacter valiniphilus TaxID=2676122 RepID=UPI003735737C